MVSYVFDKILQRGIKNGQAPGRTRSAREWFRRAARRTRTTPNSLVNENVGKTTFSVNPGDMYMFFYDPKHKETLPYYDRFPVIFPVSMTKDGFIGINLHYISPALRAKLMDALYTLSTDKKYNEATKLMISYQILNASTKFKQFKPCVKRYIHSHVKSKFLKVDASEWDIALFLPTERFIGASRQRVWGRSARGL